MPDERVSFDLHTVGLTVRNDRIAGAEVEYGAEDQYEYVSDTARELADEIMSRVEVAAPDIQVSEN